MQQQRNGFIHSLVRLSNGGKHLHIRPAESRYVLKKFGGTKTIEEFREGFISYDCKDESIFTSPKDDLVMNFTDKTPCSEIEFMF